MVKRGCSVFYVCNTNVKVLPGIGVQVDGEYKRMEHKAAC